MGLVRLSIEMVASLRVITNNSILSISGNDSKIAAVQSAAGIVSPQATNKPLLYAPNENAYTPWIDVFEYTHEASDGPVDFIGIAMGADGMREPKAVVVQDGMMLEIQSTVPTIRVDFDSVYEEQQDKYLAVMGDKKASRTKRKPTSASIT